MSHTSSMIKNFGAINGYTTETYEFLHKFYVKDPYKFSNKKNEMKQILKRVCWYNIISMKAILKNRIK